MKSSEVRRNAILGAAGRNGIISRSVLAKRVGIPRSTMYKRLSNPGEITISELCQIDHRLRLTDKEIIDIVRGK